MWRSVSFYLFFYLTWCFHGFKKILIFFGRSLFQSIIWLFWLTNSLLLCIISLFWVSLIVSKKPSHVFTTSSRHFDSASHCFKKILIILVFCRRLSQNSHVDSLNKNDDIPCHYFAFWYRSFCRVSNSLFHCIIFQYSISFFWHSNLLIWLTTSSFEDIISSFWRRSYLTVPWSNELLSQNNDGGG